MTTRQRTYLMPATCALALLIAGAVWWQSRRHATSTAQHLYTQTLAMQQCLLGRPPPNSQQALHAAFAQRLALEPRDLKLSTTCAEAIASATDATRKHAAVLLHRSPDQVKDLTSETRSLAERGSQPVADIAKKKKTTAFATSLFRIRTLACDIASAENVFDVGACPAVGEVDARLRAPMPRLIHGLDFAHSTRVAWDALEFAGRPTVAIAGGDGQIVVAGLEVGGKWLVSTAKGLPTPAPRPPTLIAGASDRRYVTHVSKAEAGWRVQLFDLGDKSAGPLRTVSLPAGFAPVSAGAVAGVVSEADRDTLLVIPVTRTEAGGKGDGVLTVSLVSDDLPHRLVELTGQVVAGLSGSPPRVLLSVSSGTGAARFALYELGGTDTEPRLVTTSDVSYMPRLDMRNLPDRVCGIKGERFHALVAQHGNHASLLAVGETEITPLRFNIKSAHAIAPWCGTCPPIAVETGPDSLALRLPVRRKLYAEKLPISARFDADSAGSVSAACADGMMAASYLTAGRLAVHGLRGKGWSFRPARLLAEPNTEGTVSKARLLDGRGRLRAVWLRERRTARSRHVRVETAESADGITWR